MNKSTDDSDKNKRKKRRKALTKADLIRALHDQRWDYRGVVDQIRKRT